MNNEDVEIMLAVLKGNVAGIEMIYSGKYKYLEQTGSFRKCTKTNLGEVIADLKEIIRALENVQRNAVNAQTED